jgi:sirohydrochlorin ferrochelatase
LEEVKLAFMQFHGPTLPEVVEAATRMGQKDFRLLPLFMASAGHVDKDIKPLVTELGRDYPEAQFDLLTPVGEHGLFPQLITDIAKESPASR